MYDFCPYCGKQLENGESCTCSNQRPTRTYDEPLNDASSAYSSQDTYNSNYNGAYNSNYGNPTSGNFNTEYYNETVRFAAEHQARSNRKHVRTFSILGIFIGVQTMMSCAAGLFALIFGAASLCFSIAAMKKNKKLDKPIALPKIALTISIVSLVLATIVGILTFAIGWGDILSELIS